MWLKTSTINVEVTKKPVGNEIAIPEPELVKRTVDGQPIERIEAMKDRKWMWKGKEVDVTIVAVDPKTKNPVPTSELREVIEHRSSLHVTSDGTTVEKDDIHFFVLAADGSIAKNEDGTDMEVAPFEPTSILDIPDENWVPSTILDGYLIRDIYELECKSKKGQQDLFSEAEKRQQLDQVGMITYSNGGFTQRIVTSVNIRGILRLRAAVLRGRQIRVAPENQREKASLQATSRHSCTNESALQRSAHSPEAAADTTAHRCFQQEEVKQVKSLAPLFFLCGVIN